MKKYGLIIALNVAVAFAGFAIAPRAAVAAEARATPAAAAVGKMLYSADGKKLAAVYKVTESGAAVILLDGKQYAVPASTLSDANGKFSTTLTKKDIFTR